MNISCDCRPGRDAQQVNALFHPPAGFLLFIDGTRHDTLSIFSFFIINSQKPHSLSHAPSKSESGTPFVRPFFDKSILFKTIEF